MPRTLTEAADIRTWAEAHAGSPMMADIPDGRGDTRPFLQLSFGQDSINAEGNEGPERVDGLRLVAWDEWLEALDQLGLAVRVHDDGEGTDPNFEFVPR